MALTACVECKGSVSDTAATCPHCGVAAPALSQEQKAQAVATFKRAAYGRMGGWLFFSGVAWLLITAGSGAGADGFTAAWGMAKWLIFAGAGMYIISEIERNLAEAKQRKAASKL